MNDSTDKAHAIQMLRKFCPPGTTVYNVLRHVSASGMTRHIASPLDIPALIRRNAPRAADGTGLRILDYLRQREIVTARAMADWLWRDEKQSGGGPGNESRP